MYTKLGSFAQSRLGSFESHTPNPALGDFGFLPGAAAYGFYKWKKGKREKKREKRKQRMSLAIQQEQAAAAEREEVLKKQIEELKAKNAELKQIQQLEAERAAVVDEQEDLAEEAEMTAMREAAMPPGGPLPPGPPGIGPPVGAEYIAMPEQGGGLPIVPIVLAVAGIGAVVLVMMNR